MVEYPLAAALSSDSPMWTEIYTSIISNYRTTKQLHLRDSILIFPDSSSQNETPQSVKAENLFSFP